MKKLLLFKNLMLVIFLAGMSLAGWSQVLYEDFNYATPAYIGGNGNAGASSNNWTTHSVTAAQTTTIDVVDNSLSYTGLASTTGNKILIPGTNSAVSRDINRGFISTATVLYYSVLINVVDATQLSSSAADYFMSFGATSGTSVTSLAGRLGIKSVNTAANYRLSIGNNSGGTLVYTDFAQDLNFGTTYLVVVKLDRSTSPVAANLWINTSNLGGSEPSGSVTCTSGTGTFAAFTSICIRNGAGTPKANIDEIRVGETWASVTPAATVTPTITITSPVNGYQWTQGTSHDINWTAIGTNSVVLIEYTANASDPTPTWVKLISTNANPGVYSSWDIPADQVLSADSKIRITDVPQTATGLSGTFSIIAAPAPVATFNPADAATVVAITSDITITYDVPIRNLDNSEITDANVASLVTLTTTDALGTVIPFTATIDALKKVITINPVSDLINEQLYYVAIAPVEGLSDNATVTKHITFTSAPSLTPTISDVTIAETAPYYAGDMITIKWVSKNVTNVQIEVWIPSNNAWTVIIPSTPSDGSETYTIPLDAWYSTDYKIRVSDIANAGLNAESSIFTIEGAINNVTITEVAPYSAGDLITVNWVAKNIASVKIELYDPAISTWSLLENLINAADGSKLVTLPVTLAASTNYKVRVTDEASTASAESSSFAIIAALSAVTITEVAPYFSGDALTVNWVAKNILAVNIELFDPATATWSELASMVTDAGSKSVTLPATLPYNTGYKVRVSDATGSTANAESAVFTVIAVANDLLTLRAQPAGAIVKYTGIGTVTFTRTTRNQKYIQDATAAVLIDDPTTAPGFITGTYKISDGITNIIGKIVLYGGLVEFTPTAITGEPETGIEIVPEVRTLASLTSADQCKLVKIENFAFKTPRKFVKSLTYGIDGYDSLAIAYRTIFAESDYIGGQAPVGLFSSICLVGQYNAQMQITARAWSDMMIPTVAAFETTTPTAFTGDNVQFTDLSSFNPLSWEWTFDGGFPSTSTDQNPLIKYATAGVYSVTLKATNAYGNSTLTKTNYITVESGVGLSNLPSTVSIYPNPTNGRLFITNPATEKQEIAVFNSVGKQVKSAVSADGLISLDITTLSKGMYLVKITNKSTKSVKVKKVILN